MEQWLITVITVVGSVLASSGFWAFLQTIRDKKDVRSKMILGLGHDRIIELCLKYLERGWISAEEYENLYKYLYKPYKAMGGNGSAERLMAKVSNLEVRNTLS